MLDNHDDRSMISNHDLRRHPLETWTTTTWPTPTMPIWPVAIPESDLETALRTMEETDVATLPVLDANGSFVGMDTRNDIVNLDEILRTTEADN